jgi:hypothetical protein
MLLIFIENLVHFTYINTAISYILWTFGIFCCHFVTYTFPFWYVVPSKIWQPCTCVWLYFDVIPFQALF